MTDRQDRCKELVGHRWNASSGSSGGQVEDPPGFSNGNRMPRATSQRPWISPSPVSEHDTGDAFPCICNLSIPSIWIVRKTLCHYDLFHEIMLRKRALRKGLSTHSIASSPWCLIRSSCDQIPILALDYGGPNRNKEMYSPESVYNWNWIESNRIDWFIWKSSADINTGCVWWSLPSCPTIWYALRFVEVCRDHPEATRTGSYSLVLHIYMYNRKRKRTKKRKGQNWVTHNLIFIIKSSFFLLSLLFFYFFFFHRLFLESRKRVTGVRPLLVS